MVCPFCQDQTWIPVEGKNAVRRCQCYVDRQLEKIPKRFVKCTFQSYYPKDRTQESAKRSMEGNPGSSFFLFGHYGRGKTHLLYAQYRQVILSGRRGFIRTTKQLIDELVDLELDKGNSQILEAVGAAEPIHLFWDDIDKLKPTEFKHEVLYDLVDKIYRNSHKLTATSNIDITQLGTVLGEAMARRIDDICRVVRV